MRRLLSLAVAGALLTGCAETDDGQTIVASIYPLAFAAERLAGPGWEVIDLTPPGVEAHDLDLTLDQRSAIQDADMVVYLGEIGFQPQVERAVQESEGTVVDLSVALDQRGEPVDPHAWLEPFSFDMLVKEIAGALCALEDPCSPEESARQESFSAELLQLHEAYTQGLSGCRYRTMIVAHEAFGYLEIHRLRQFGLAGVTPEAEPSAGRLTEARRLIDNDEADALFYEARGEDPDADMALAEDLGVTAHPLDTLESAPPEGDYMSVIGANLDSLREGLQCR